MSKDTIAGLVGLSVAIVFSVGLVLKGMELPSIPTRQDDSVISRARDFGKRARLAGVPANANPYRHYDSHSVEWLEGWIEATPPEVSE